MDAIWGEKYRPKRIDDIIGQEEVVKRVKGFIEGETLPNLLLWGHKGTGKTSLVYALARELYGDFWEENLLFIQTSDFAARGKRWLKEDRRFKLFYDEGKSGIEIFKRIIREYAAMAPINAPFRILYFSNADFLLSDAQHALRRIIETYNKTSRFIFSATESAGIITPLRSRCLNLHFKPLDSGSNESDAMQTLIKTIAAKEGIKMGETGVKTLKRYAGGDAGVATTIMEAAAVSAKSKMIEIDENKIREVVKKAFLHREKIDEMVELALAGEHREAKKKVQFLMEEEKMGGKEILQEVHLALRRNKEMAAAKTHAHLILEESEADFKLCHSLNDMIHIEEMLARFGVKSHL